MKPLTKETVEMVRQGLLSSEWCGFSKRDTVNQLCDLALKGLSFARPEGLRKLAERCRPAVAHDARLRERDVNSDKYAPHYKATLQAESERAGKLLDDIDNILKETA